VIRPSARRRFNDDRKACPYILRGRDQPEECSLNTVRLKSISCYISTIGWRLRHIFFVLKFQVTLWSWPLRYLYDLLTLTVSVLLSFIHQTYKSIWSILRYTVPDDSIWSHFHLMQRSLRMCRVTWSITGEGEMIHNFDTHDPNFFTSRALRRML